MAWFGSRNNSEKWAKFLSAVAYIAVNIAALFFACGYWKPVGDLWRPFPLDLWNYLHLDLPPEVQAALLAPLLSIGIFGCLHWRDTAKYEKYKKGEIGIDKLIWGLESRKAENNADPGDYASSAISRLSLHSAIAAGVIWGIKGSGTAGLVTIVSLTAGTLGLAIIMGMVAVLCYAQSTRWTAINSKNPKQEKKLQTKRELLDKASLRDQQAWYLLTTGLLWAVAIVSPVLSILASLLYGLLLWRYYFRWDEKSIDKAEDTPAATAATDLKPLVDAFSDAQKNLLEKVQVRLGELETANQDQKRRIAELETNAAKPKPPAAIV